MISLLLHLEYEWAFRLDITQHTAIHTIFYNTQQYATQYNMLHYTNILYTQCTNAHQREHVSAEETVFMYSMGTFKNWALNALAYQFIVRLSGALSAWSFGNPVRGAPVCWVHALSSPTPGGGVSQCVTSLLSLTLSPRQWKMKEMIAKWTICCLIVHLNMIIPFQKSFPSESRLKSTPLLPNRNVCCFRVITGRS